MSSEERATSDRFLTRLRALPLLFFASFFVLSRALRLFAHEGRCENTCRSFCRSAHRVPRNHAIPGFAEGFLDREERRSEKLFRSFFLIKDQDYGPLIYLLAVSILILYPILLVYPFNFILENVNFQRLLNYRACRLRHF